MNPLAATQRDFIRHHNERNENIEIEELGNVVSTDQVSVDMNTNKSQAKEQTAVFVLKCLILVTVFLALLIGTAVIVVEANKDDDPTSRGRVFTEKPQEECPDKISVALGETYSIQCTFPARLTPSNVTAIYKNVAVAKTSDFKCHMKVNTSTINVQCTSVNATKCSSVGDVEIRLLDSKNKVKHTRKVGTNIKVPDRDFSTTIQQIYNGNGSTSIFHLKCESRGYCLSHDMKFVEDKTNKDITDTMSCKTVYSDNEGYTVSCNTEVSSDVIYQYGNGSSLYCLFMQGTKEVYKREFSLPGCDDYAVRNTECNSNMKTLFDCDDTSSVTNDCTQVCKVAKECYSLRVQEFPTASSSSCATECILDWCRHRNTRHIDTSGALSFQYLCNLG